MTVKQLRDAMKGLKGDVYVEIVMPAYAGANWLMPINSTSKENNKFQIRISNPQ